MPKNTETKDRIVEYRLCGIPNRDLFNASLWGGISDKIPLAVRQIDKLGRIQRETRMMCAITTMNNDKQSDESWIFCGFVRPRKARHFLRCRAVVVSGGPDLGILTVTIPSTAGI